MNPLNSPIAVPDSEPGEQTEQRRPAVLDAEHRHHAGGEAADRADREVDLAEQQDEHDADRDRRHGGDLQGEVGEVYGGEEAVVGDLEDRPDDRDPDQHPDRGEVAAGECPQRPPEREALGRACLGAGAVPIVPLRRTRSGSRS